MNGIKQSNTRLVWKESRARKQTSRLSVCSSQRSHLLTQQWFRTARTTVLNGLRPKRLTPSLDVFTQTQGLPFGATAFFQKKITTIQQTPRPHPLQTLHDRNSSGFFHVLKKKMLFCSCFKIESKRAQKVTAFTLKNVE